MVNSIQLCTLSHAPLTSPPPPFLFSVPPPSSPPPSSSAAILPPPSSSLSSLLPGPSLFHRFLPSSQHAPKLPRPPLSQHTPLPFSAFLSPHFERSLLLLRCIAVQCEGSS
ncbi:hypothetical protein ElyMa_004954100 [Elysia marginata]|uniref:Uncharacterized protein n=1 Tax=Elysia marginata TaxID=1093978 RepID=A0AAV4J2Z9_9GAST|nr:hypothetical protein ElyMa_004954100 [Elysia marginata]